MYGRTLNVSSGFSRFGAVATRALLLALTGLSLSLIAADVAEAGKRRWVSVYPTPGTPVASDRTTFSFRGIEAKNLGPVRVVGSASGRHGGRLLRHSDGRGVSFVPKRRFRRGELVRVYSRKKIVGAPSGNFRVRIGRFPDDNRKKMITRARNRFPAMVTRPRMRPPALKVHASEPTATKRKIFFAPKATGLTIADNRGRVSWFLPTGHGGGGQVVQDFRRQTYRGKPVLTYYKASAGPKGRWQYRRFHIRNRSYRKIASFGLGNGYRPDAHEFVISRRNTALVIGYRATRWDLRRLGGTRDSIIIDNVIQEIDIKTGAVLFEWHSLGNVPVSDSVVRPGTGAGSWDYFHANSVEDDGNSFLVSARKVSTIYRIDKKSGRIRWRLRGDGQKRGSNDFSVGPKARFGFQHDARRLPNGDISLFDNSVVKRYASVRSQSSGLVLRLRKKGKKRATAGMVKRFQPPRPVLARSQGSTEILPGGNAFVGWGSVKRITEFTPKGKVAFDASFSTPVNAYRARKATWEGRAPGRPAIASQKWKKYDGMSVWASWNGAGNIESWRVLLGPDKDSLAEVVTAPWAGLETRIPLPKVHDKQVRVEALDAEGNVLARSAVMPTGTRSHGKPRVLP